MDELREFFNAPPEKRIVHLKGPKTGGFRVNNEAITDKFSRKEQHQQTSYMSGSNYERESKRKELLAYLQHDDTTLENQAYGLESMEKLPAFESQQNLPQLTEEAMNEVYNKYTFKQKQDTLNLSINHYKNEIMDKIANKQVTIIEGPTGCGKTTQVPQWILEDNYDKRRYCKIVVTQPRRIAAISIAKRVAHEQGWDVGGLVGYQVGLENRTTTDTRIHYVTTGVLLQKLVAAKSLNEYTHIILDEVHERGQEMDFLLLVVRKFLFTVSRNVKIILMSATFNYEVFASYFQVPKGLDSDDSCWVNIEKKRSTFSVSQYYLESLQHFGPATIPKSDQPGVEPEMYHLVVKLISQFEFLDKKEDGVYDVSGIKPSVLIFLPGINEIEELYELLTDIKKRKAIAGAESGNHKWRVLPLHSTITADEQVRVFLPAEPGHRKIIISTNIAESSITVPDVKYVVDFCLMKVLVADSNTNFTSLQLQWASKTNCEQRAGRAGRVMNGRVYRLVPSEFYKLLSQECAPEIRRCPLERLVLLAKMLDLGTPTQILALAMDPPDLSNIQRTILILKEMGALKKTVGENLSLIDGDITYLGRVMAKLPIDVVASKLIMLGHIYGCLDETVIIAAAMTVRNVFNSPFRERLNAYKSKLTWADGSTSDCYALLHVYKVWRHLSSMNTFRQQDEVSWARKFYVQLRAIKELDALVRELKRRLSQEGIDSIKASPWTNNELALVLKVLIAGAFYPNYFVQVGCDENRERDALKMLGGKDPRCSVYLKDFPQNQSGPLYASAIRQIVKQMTGDEPSVTFDGISQKVFLTFDESTNSGKKDKQKTGNPSMPGKVVLAVYKAVKVRQLRMDIRLPLLSDDKAKEMEAELELSNLNIRKNLHLLVPRLPDIEESHIPIRISQLVNCGSFWAQYDDDSTRGELIKIQQALNKQPLLAHTGPVSTGEIYVAPYQDKNGTFKFRVRVKKMLPQDMVWVLYIDYGFFGQVLSTNLWEVPKGIANQTPPLALECSLAEVSPSAILDSHEQWSVAATEHFYKLTSRGKLFAKVYSVYNGIVSVTLLADNGDLNINQNLIEHGFAQPSEECYDSKYNHDLRENCADLELAQKRAFNKQQMEQAFKEIKEIELPRHYDCVRDVLLKGPFSPLESKVNCIMFANRNKPVTIEWNSVNSVLLDTEPQETYERLLVAGMIGTNQSGDKLTLRHTTLMPNIPGLPAIISLLFCPQAEFRRDELATRYVSALCGLGHDSKGAPLFPEHDLLVNIDVDLRVEDIELINHIRHLMDYMMFCEEGQDNPVADDQIRKQVPVRIRNELLRLLKTRRKHRELCIPDKAWEWMSVKEDDLLTITDPSLLRHEQIYPLHTPLDLYPISKDVLIQLQMENEQLKEQVTRNPFTSMKEVKCNLCGTGKMTTQAMRIHLYSRGHKEKEEDFRVLDD